jgi:hypothetical protein
VFSAATASPAQKFFFPEPLNNRVMSMQPLIKPKPAWQPEPPVWQPMPPFNFPQQPPPMYPGAFFPSQEMMMMMPANYGMEQYPLAPITQATLSNYFQQMINNPQLSTQPFNQGLGNYSAGNPNNTVINNNNLNELVRRHFLQQQRLNYNHERLLERYGRLHTPVVSEFRSYGTSALPGRNYDEYLQGMRGDDNFNQNSVAAQSRAGIGSSNETYRWMGNEYYEPLPRDVNSTMQHSRNDPMPFVNAEKFEPVKIYNHPIFGLIPAYIRPVFKKKNQKKIKSNHDHKIADRLPYQNRKTQNEHLIPVNPLLFNMYNQRLNGSIQGYGQSLYVPSGHYEDIISSSRSHESPPPPPPSSSSKPRYSKLHPQLTVTSMLNQSTKPFTSGKNKCPPIKTFESMFFVIHNYD